MQRADTQLFGVCSRRAGGYTSLLAEVQLIYSHYQGGLPQAQPCAVMAGDVTVIWEECSVETCGCACITCCKSGYHKSFCLLTFPMNLCWPGPRGPRLVCSPCQIISCLLVNAIPIDQFPAGLYWFSLIQCKCFACRNSSVNVPMRSKLVPLSLLLFKSYCHSCSFPTLSTCLFLGGAIARGLVLERNAHPAVWEWSLA